MKKLIVLSCSMLFSITCYATSSSPCCSQYESTLDCSKVLLDSCKDDQCKKTTCAGFITDPSAGHETFCEFDSAKNQCAEGTTTCVQSGVSDDCPEPAGKS